MPRPRSSVAIAFDDGLQASVFLLAQLRPLKGRGGFIDYAHTRRISLLGEDYFKTAGYHFHQQRYRIAWQMACAALEVFNDTLDYADDSNGDVGYCINEASDPMMKIIHEKLPEDLRQECFGYCTEAYRKGAFSGWDWHELMMDIAIRLVRTDKETATLHKLLDTVLPSGESWDWNYQQAEVQRYHLISKTESKENAEGFLMNHLHNSTLRKLAMDHLIVSKKYPEAIKLAEQGIKKDQKDLPGLADDWRRYLLEIYRLQNDGDNILKYAFYLLVYSNQPREELYELIKSYTPVDEWEDQVRQIVQALKQHGRFGSEYQVAWIYKREQWWNELFDLINQSRSISFLNEYEKDLPAMQTRSINGI